MPEGKCFNCGKPVEKDMYCYGGATFVCDDCDVSASSLPIGVGNHGPEDHLREPEPEEA